MARAFRVSAINREEKTRSVIYSTDRKLGLYNRYIILKWIFWTWRCYLVGNTRGTSLSLTPSIIFNFDDFSNYLIHSSSPDSIFLVHFVSWFIDLYMFIQSRRSSRLVEIITTLILFFIMLHIYGNATATESYLLRINISFLIMNCA